MRLAKASMSSLSCVTQGNVICVTHDRELIDAFANRIIELHADGSMIDFKGDYETFRETYGR